MNHILGTDIAVAGVVVNGHGVDFFAHQQSDDRGSTGFAVLVGHVTRLGHQGSDLDRIAQNVHVFGRFGFESQEIHFAPALVGRGQTRVDGDVASTHARNHVENTGLDVFVELELHGLVGYIHIGHVVLAAVLNDAFVAVSPGLLEQTRLRSDVVVGVQDQHLALGLCFGEVVGHLASPLVRTGRASVWGHRDGHGEDAAVGHSLELLAKGHGLLAGFPGVHHLLFGACTVHAGQGFPHKVHTGRDDQAVISQLGATGQFDNALVGIDGVDAVLDDLDAVALGQVVIGCRDLSDGFAAANDEVGHRARNEGIAWLDQGDLDLVFRPHAQVLGGRGTRVTPADDHHFGATATTHGGTTRNQSHGTQSGACL